MVELQDLDGLRSVEELSAYKKLIDEGIKDLDAQRAGLPLEEEQRSQFASLVDTRKEIDRRVKELEARIRIVAELAEDPKRTERAFEKNERMFEMEGRGNSKERDIYNLQSLRHNPFMDPESSRAELLDRLKASQPARIVTTSSGAHEGARIPFDDLNAERSWGGAGFSRYGETKLANILFTAELARRLEGTGVTANAFHPGFVATGFNRNNGVLMRLGMAITRPFARSPRKGAESLVWLADAEEASQLNGAYVFDGRPVAPSPAAQDVEAARRLWRVSEEQTAKLAG